MVVGALLVLAVLWIGWTLAQTQRDLTAAQDSYDRLAAAVVDGDAAARAEALADFEDAAAGAAGRTDGPTWSLLTRVPGFGDDAHAIRGLSRSLDELSAALPPILDIYDRADGLTQDQQIDTDAVAALEEPLAAASVAVGGASDSLVDESTA